MKKLLLSIVLLSFVCFNINAQCLSLPSGTLLLPTFDSIPCAEQGIAYSSLLKVGMSRTIPSPFGLMVVNSLTIDSIIGLPTGITHSTDSSVAALTRCITFSGTTFVPIGDYDINIYVCLDITIPMLGNQILCDEFSNLISQIEALGAGPLGDTSKPILRVISQGMSCPQGIGTIAITSRPRIIVGSPCGGGLVTLDADVAGGSGNFSISWTGSPAVNSPNSEITDVTIPSTGSFTYTVQAIDLVEGDTSIGNITINTSNVPYLVDAGNNTSIGCSGGSTALLTASITTGNGAGSSYVWSNGQRGLSILAVPGTYTVTVTDAGGCLTATDEVTVFGNIAVDFRSVHENCGAGNGSITTIASGGNGQLTYNWSNGQSTPNLSGLSAGTYLITITDMSNCNIIDSISVLDSCGIIQGMVFDDLNGNGVINNGESGIAGVEVVLNNGLRGCSNSNGSYEIVIPAYGNYTANVDTPYRYYCFNSLNLPDAITSPSTGSYAIIINVGNSRITGLDFGLARPTTPCGEVSGHVFEDQNGNGIKEPSDMGYPSQMISVDPVGFAFTDAVGNYSSDAPFNTPLTISGPPFFNSYFCGIFGGFGQTFPTNPLNYTRTVTPGNPLSINNDFGFGKNSGADVGVYNVASYNATICQSFSVWMDWKTTGTIASDCYLFLEFDSSLTFVNSVPPVDTVGVGFIGWYFPAGSISTFECYSMEFFVGCDPAQIGSTLEFTGRWSCDTPDGCPANDELTRTTTISGSTPKRSGNDNNALFVYHQNDEERVAINYADSSFSYLISFKNNTQDTAYRMTIVDTLPPYFQLSTISYPFASKPFTFEVKSDNILVWEFEDLNLPPARDNLLRSYGFVQFNVVMNRNLPLGTRFENKASITFNYTAAIHTNTVENILSVVSVLGLETNKHNVSIFPNPTSGSFDIRASVEETATWNIELYNIAGVQLVSIVEGNQRELKISIDLADYPKGIYLLKIRNEEVVITRKVVVQ